MYFILINKPHPQVSCENNVKKIVLSSFSSQVASGHLDKTVRFWDVR